MTEFQAGGTDVQDRRRRGTSRGPLQPLGPDRLSDAIAWRDDGASIGALVRIATVAHDARMRASYPGLAAAAGGLATPQIRAVATVGGGLLQRTRCWYFRDPSFDCFKKGGASCPARDGDHVFGVCVDLGPCIWPHPSTLGAALLAYDAAIETTSGRRLTAEALFGDGRDPSRDHHLDAGEVLAAVHLGAPVTHERAAYLRVIGRALAEWPLVEAVVRLVVADERIAFARVAVGGVANVPLRLRDLEQALIGAPATPVAIAQAAEAWRPAAPGLAQTDYKRRLIPVAIADAAARALAPASAPPSAATWALPWISR